MDPEVRKILEETHALAKDNHRMLRAIRRDQWFGFFGRIIVWAVVLLLPLYLYQEYLRPLVDRFASLSGIPAPSGTFGLPTSAELQKLLNSFKAGQ